MTDIGFEYQITRTRQIQKLIYVNDRLVYNAMHLWASGGKKLTAIRVFPNEWQTLIRFFSRSHLAIIEFEFLLCCDGHTGVNGWFHSSPADSAHKRLESVHCALHKLWKVVKLCNAAQFELRVTLFSAFVSLVYFNRAPDSLIALGFKAALVINAWCLEPSLERSLFNRSNSFLFPPIPPKCNYD